MALAPLTRPAGSSQLLRYLGTFATSNANANVYPKLAGEIPLNSTVTGAYFDAYIRFPLFDATDATSRANLARQFPQFVFDDTQPSAEGPHSPVACTASATPGVQVTDLSLNRDTWAQNMEITFVEAPTTTPLVQSCNAYISADANPANGAVVVLDNSTTSGLGLGTGLPVLIVHFRVLANGGVIQAFNGALTIEIRHSTSR